MRVAFKILSAILLAAAPMRADDFAEVTIHGIAFIQIPAGKFTMGTTDETKAQLEAAKAWTRFEKVEQPAHEVTITKPFLIGKFEITQKQWAGIVGKKAPSTYKGDDLPVESVSWPEVQAFLAALNKAEPKHHFRLPTEAQWEYCARAGSAAPYGLAKEDLQITQENLGDFAWFAANAGNKTHPVGTKKPNAWGLFDMHGNVWEWCQDWFDRTAYTSQPATDPLNNDATRSTERVLRGGSWFLAAPNLRSAYRGANLPDQKSAYIGFRIVADP